MPQQEALAALDPMLGEIHQGKAFGQPSNSADSHQTIDTPFEGLDYTAIACSQVPDVLCGDYSFGRFGEIGAWQQQMPLTQQHPGHPYDATIALLASARPSLPSSAACSAELPEDPAAAKAVFKQLASQMTPAEMTELQHMLREQRLQRQQQCMFMQPSLEAASVPALGYSAASMNAAVPAAGTSDMDPTAALQQSLGPADALKLVGEMAVAITAALSQPSSSCNPALITSFLSELAGKFAVPQTASQFQQVPQQQQLEQLVTPPPCFGGVAQLAPTTVDAAAADDIHPGSTSCRGTCSRHRRPRMFWNLAALPWVEASIPPPAAAAAAAADVTAAAVVPAAGPTHHQPCPDMPVVAAAAPMQTSDLSSDSSLKARFSRLSAEVQASILSQLHDLEAAEEERRAAKEARRAAREAAAAHAQRKSSRARKVKVLDDADQVTATGTRSASPDPVQQHMEQQQRDGSAAPDNGNLEQQHSQQQQPVKKRVRFADDYDTDSDDDSRACKAVRRSSSESPDCQGSPGAEGGLPVFAGLNDAVLDMMAVDGGMIHDDDAPVVKRRIVRRIGPRAQARKRMHKKTIRKRRPQRAPLN